MPDFGRAGGFQGRSRGGRPIRRAARTDCASHSPIAVTGMTAEIAIISKSAVALAADSAVTISAGSKQEKIFDTADKLFELCDRNPIGIMIYNGMNFADTPMPSLIRLFRSKGQEFKSVEEAGLAFLGYLHDFGSHSPVDVLERNIKIIVGSVLRKINDKAVNEFTSTVIGLNSNANNSKPSRKASYFEKLASDIYERTIDDYLRVLESLGDASFIVGPLVLDHTADKIIEDLIVEIFGIVSTAQKRSPPTSAHRKKLKAIGTLALRKNALSDGLTGVVIAGFGKDELFPTLISYEIDGIVCGET